MNQQQQVHFYKLITALVEGTINPEQFEQFKRTLKEQPNAKSLYVEYMAILSHFHSIEAAEVFLQEDSGLDMKLWQELADNEKNATAIPIKKKPVKSPLPPIPKSLPQRKYEPPKRNKWSLYTAIVSTAALVFLLVFLHVNQNSNQVDVATITDQINAQWGQGVVKNGQRLHANQQPHWLRSGLAEITYDQGVELIIEGPATFEIDKSAIYFEYGKVYARVSKQGIGFTVHTQNSQIIDLGTEFGVQAFLKGSTELHVMKGKTLLIAGSDHESKDTHTINEGDAKRVDENSDQAQDIALEEQKYVRHINSKSNMIWQGQRYVDLADFVGGGNGFGSGKMDLALNVFTGKNHKAFKRASLRYETMGDRCFGDYRFHTVPKNHFIDGVFIPDGSKGPVQVTSQGHVFQDCPSTSNLFFLDPINGNMKTADGPQRGAVLEGIEYGVPGRPCLFLHSNLGITFDLDVIRQNLPGCSISALQSRVGISENASSLIMACVDVWILLDGDLVKNCSQIKRGEYVDLNISLKRNARFLTLITTDAGYFGEEWDYENRKEIFTPIVSDHCFFAEPRLILEDE